MNQLDTDRNVVATDSFGGQESSGDGLNPNTDGVQSDVWDYIGVRNSVGNPDQDFDMVIDNVMIRSIAAP